VRRGRFERSEFAQLILPGVPSPRIASAREFLPIFRWPSSKGVVFTLANAALAFSKVQAGSLAAPLRLAILKIDLEAALPNGIWLKARSIPKVHCMLRILYELI
jgi:hypothetical protein